LASANFQQTHPNRQYWLQPHVYVEFRYLHTTELVHGVRRRKQDSHLPISVAILPCKNGGFQKIMEEKDEGVSFAIPDCEAYWRTTIQDLETLYATLQDIRLLLKNTRHLFCIVQILILTYRCLKLVIVMSDAYENKLFTPIRQSTNERAPTRRTVATSLVSRFTQMLQIGHIFRDPTCTQDHGQRNMLLVKDCLAVAQDEDQFLRDVELINQYMELNV